MRRQKKINDPASEAAIGARIRAARLKRNLSQTELATALGVTFQQVQKYEKGTNRVAATRLRVLARILKTPILFFLPGAEENSEESKSVDASLGLLNAAGAMRLLEAYAEITDSKARSALVDLAERLVE